MNDKLENMEPDKNKIESFRLKVDLLKWFVGGIAAVLAFFLIKPHEQDRLDKALQLEVHKAYLSATNTTSIDLWQRKLNLMKAMVDDKDIKIKNFIKKEQDTINSIRSEKTNLKQTETDKAGLIEERNNLVERIAELSKKLNQSESVNTAKKERLENQKKDLLDKIAEFNQQIEQKSELEKNSKEKLQSQGAVSDSNQADGQIAWYAVLASLPGDKLEDAIAEANKKYEKAQVLGFSQGVQLFKTKISNNYAVVLGGALDRTSARSLSSDARSKELAIDSFPQIDRDWTFVGTAPFNR